MVVRYPPFKAANSPDPVQSHKNTANRIYTTIKHHVAREEKKVYPVAAVYF